MVQTAAFNYKNARVTVQKPTVASRVKMWQFRQIISTHGSGGVPQDIADTLCYYLANVVEIAGSIGFSVPTSNITHAELIETLTAFADADELLISLWDTAIINLKYAMNDPDLLPPMELDEKKEPPPA